MTLKKRKYAKGDKPSESSARNRPRKPKPKPVPKKVSKKK